MYILLNVSTLGVPSHIYEQTSAIGIYSIDVSPEYTAAIYCVCLIGDYFPIWHSMNGVLECSLSFMMLHSASIAD